MRTPFEKTVTVDGSYSSINLTFVVTGAYDIDERGRYQIDIENRFMPEYLNVFLGGCMDVFFTEEIEDIEEDIKIEIKKQLIVDEFST